MNDSVLVRNEAQFTRHITTAALTRADVAETNRLPARGGLCTGFDQTLQL
ncbi:hypothetical protein [Brucella sp. NBRC 12950]|nr:hypothetical protein [Brucella sp. NBRC 12950]